MRARLTTASRWSGLLGTPEVAAPGTPYFERADPRHNAVDDLMLRGWSLASRRATTALRRRRLWSFVDAAESAGHSLGTLSDAALREEATMLRGRLLRDGIWSSAGAVALALARESTARQIGLRHHRVQMLGAAVMLDRSIAEMETGEGKTITALLTAAVFGLAGRPVHVVTVNDYLAGRDAEHLGPVYAALGLTVGLIAPGQAPERRREAYASDIVYCTNKDVVFDYLRDRMAMGLRRARAHRLIDAALTGVAEDRLLLKGLHVAIVDEADSILIDEARTPLILSGTDDGAGGNETFATALELARALRLDEDYRLLPRDRALVLSEAGRARLADLVRDKDGLWRIRRAREELAEQALMALHMYQRDRQYIVADGKVQIVDEFTGRIMPDREWENGLHQMIEAKEGCAMSGRRRTMARITYQRFFRRYGHLCGMTGTAAEVATELRVVFDLAVIRVPTHRPSRRRNIGRQLYVTDEARWAAIVQSARAHSAQGRAVLIGTRSVEASEHLAALLGDAGVQPVVLNARQDQDEARIVAGAGQAGRITVATNMAGRGTDIRLSREVRDAGGLHVILTEFHEAGRIDRQLFGRGARQGDPGSYEAIVAVNDELFQRFLAPAKLAAALRLADAQGRVPARLAGWLVRSAQAEAERRNAQIRRETLANDARLDSVLAFAGKNE